MIYPIGIQNFEKLRTGDWVYVDKTAFVYKLVTAGSYYFLSRPRRFGKSLLLSTFEAYFEGKKDLFKGLAIEGFEKDWAEYPVLYLDLNSGNYSGNEKSLDNNLNDALVGWEAVYGESAAEVDYELRFKGVVRRAYEKTGKNVVILVDEYDKPMIETIDNPELYEKYRRTLKAFYSVLKSQDQYIRFAFLTGVSKFSKVSVFSDLNNLNDISMDPRYATLCGITEGEIDTYFSEELEKLAEKRMLTVEEARARMKEQYNGYHFCEDSEGVYNPFSLLNALDKQNIKNYWFDTATPSMLAKILKETDFTLDRLDEVTATADILGSIETMHDNPIPLIYQSGYLTIQGYDAEFGEYRLGFPNKEVEESFTKYLLQYYVPSTKNDKVFSLSKFVGEVREGKAEEFMNRLRAMLADNDYQVAGDAELYFHNVILLIFKMLGFYTEVEKNTSSGRIDLVVKTRAYIYIIEFKLDGSAEEALKQIEEKNYALPYSASGKTIIKIGINFSSKTRGIAEWKQA